MNFTEILNLFKAGKSEAHSHMKNLIEIAAADGNFDDVEYDLLKKIAQKHGISDSKLKAIQNDPAKVEFEVPEKEEEKFSQFFDLVHMMIVDKEIHHEEMKLCNLFGGKFGYNKTKLDELIKTIQANIENGNTSEDTFPRITWML